MPYKDKQKQKLFQAKHYQQNKITFADRLKNRRKTQRAFLQELKKSGCSKCGETHVACIEFHHINIGTKEINVGYAVNRGWSKERLLKEVDKCILLCANCHRKLHYAEGNHY